MKVKYDVTLKITLIHDVDSVEGLKTNSEIANDIGQLICDEATVSNGVACYEVIESSIDVK